MRTRPGCVIWSVGTRPGCNASGQCRNRRGREDTEVETDVLLARQTRGNMVTSQWTPQTARAKPTLAPADASSRLSVSS